MAIYITGIRLSPPSSTNHEHITDVKWFQTGKSNTCTGSATVDFINKGNLVYVKGSPGVRVGMVKVEPPYQGIFADKVWTNNLLSLPRF